MGGSAGMRLPEALQLIERRILVAGEMQKPVEQHRAVTVRQDKAVAVGPVGRRGVVFEVAGEQHGREVRHAERHARVSRLRMLDGVGGKEAQGMRHFLDMGVDGRGERCRHVLGPSGLALLLVLLPAHLSP